MKRDYSRKEFIKKAGIALATTPLIASVGFPNIILPKRTDKLGVALVGLGYYSRGLLAPALQLTKHCELRGIVTGTPSKIPVWQERYDIDDSNVYNYENMHELANNDDIDVVYVVTPSGLHGKFSIIAAEAGKHVWCEKPMETTVEGCQMIIDAAQKNDVQLTIGYRMQHEPNTQTVISYADEKPYGTITKITTGAGFRANHQEGNWRTIKEMGGGALFDMGVYCINAARYATGEEPKTVTAQRINKKAELYAEVDETMAFELTFPSGAIANCRTSFAEGLNELSVECSNGWYRLQPFQSYRGVRGITSDGITLDQPISNQQAKQMDDDALSIKNSTNPMVPGEEGLLDVRICEAIFESADNDGISVQI